LTPPSIPYSLVTTLYILENNCQPKSPPVLSNPFQKFQPHCPTNCLSKLQTISYQKLILLFLCVCIVSPHKICLCFVCWCDSYGSPPFLGHSVWKRSPLGEERVCSKALLNAPNLQQKHEVVFAFVTTPIFQIILHLVQRSKNCVLPLQLKLFEFRIQSYKNN